MVTIDFVISNQGHHPKTFNPVIAELSHVMDESVTIRVASFCELRGMITPKSPFSLESIRLFPEGLRKSPSLGEQKGAIQGFGRRIGRRVVSRLFLRKRIQQWLRVPPDVVVLPNDSAFPYDLLCGILRRARIPFVLVQEGVRFPLPVEARRNTQYGSGGAIRIAAWGQSSGEYFRSVGVDAESLALTGSPRFDEILSVDWTRAARSLRNELGTPENDILTLLTNPIDDQGFCTTREKVGLVRSLVDRLMSLLVERETTLLIKTHGREDPQEYRQSLAGIPNEVVRIIDGAPLYPLLAMSAGAITMASTAGLETLLFGIPLGIMQVPKVGYAYDYVKSGAAWALPSDSPSEAVFEMLATPRQKDPAREAYLRRQLARRRGAAAEVASLIANAI